MVIEHSFVTTMPSREALTAAASQLAQIGFVAENQSGFGVGESEWRSLQMKRGKPSLRGAMGPIEYPQRIRIDCDRGRVMVAVSMETSIEKHRGRIKQDIWEKITKDYTGLMLAIATGLEDLLSRHIEPDAVTQHWTAIEEPLKLKAAKMRRAIRIIMGVIIALFCGLVIACVLGEIYHW